MAKNTIRVEIKNLDEVRRALEAAGAAGAAAMPQAVEEGAKVLQAKMIALGPGPGIGIEMDGETAYVGPLKEKFYYAFFETGTNAHWVTPKTKKALKWGDTFAARAFPGGIAPAPFMRPAVDEGSDEVAAKMGEVIKAAVE